MGSALPDVVFGTLATFLGTVGTWYLRKHRFFCSIPPVISNAVIIPFVLKYAYGVGDLLPYLALTVGAGEVITCMIFGEILLNALFPVRHVLFADDHVVSRRLRKAEQSPDT